MRKNLRNEKSTKLHLVDECYFLPFFIFLVNNIVLIIPSLISKVTNYITRILIYMIIIFKFLGKSILLLKYGSSLIIYEAHNK